MMNLDKDIGNTDTGLKEEHKLNLSSFNEPHIVSANKLKEDTYVFLHTKLKGEQNKYPCVVKALRLGTEAYPELFLAYFKAFDSSEEEEYLENEDLESLERHINFKKYRLRKVEQELEKLEVLGKVNAENQIAAYNLISKVEAALYEKAEKDLCFGKTVVSVTIDLTDKEISLLPQYIKTSKANGKVNVFCEAEWCF